LEESEIWHLLGFLRIICRNTEPAKPKASFESGLENTPSLDASEGIVVEFSRFKSEENRL